MQCPSCNADNPAGARQCGGCGTKLPRKRRSGSEAGVSAINLWIDSSNRPAIIGYRCGLLAMIPFLGLVLGPAAVFLGLLGRWRERQKRTDRGGTLAMAAIVLGVLTLLTNWAGLYFLLH